MHDLNVAVQESMNIYHIAKTKIVFYSSEALIVNFYIKAKALSIHIKNIPICIILKGCIVIFRGFWDGKILESTIFRICQWAILNLM